MQLWVAAGVAPKDVLLAATSRAAEQAGAATRLGRIAPGYDASLLIVEGNPLEDISVTERIWRVILRGEMVNRGELFEKDREKK
jgi:imidazolonepropionase-like amidohydrolase